MLAVQTEILSFISVSKLGIARNFYSRKIKMQYYESNLMPWTMQFSVNLPFVSVIPLKTVNLIKLGHKIGCLWSESSCHKGEVPSGTNFGISSWDSLFSG